MIFSVSTLGPASYKKAMKKPPNSPTRAINSTQKNYQHHERMKYHLIHPNLGVSKIESLILWDMALCRSRLNSAGLISNHLLPVGHHIAEQCSRIHERHNEYDKNTKSQNHDIYIYISFLFICLYLYLYINTSFLPDSSQVQKDSIHTARRIS